MRQQYEFLGKSLIFILILIYLPSCVIEEQLFLQNSRNKTFNQESEDINFYSYQNGDFLENKEVKIYNDISPIYNIIFVNSSDFYDPRTYPLEKYWWNEIFSFYVPQITKMENIQLKEKINKTLTNELLNWIGGYEALHADGLTLEVIFFSNRYISIKQNLGGAFPITEGHDHRGHEARPYTTTIYINIDMQTGERVFLQDLIRINDDFFNLFWQGGIVFHFPYIDEFHKITNEKVAEMRYEEIRRLLYQYNDQPVNLSFDKWAEGEAFRFWDSPHFFLEHNKLIIVSRAARLGNLDVFYALSLDDIPEFLKVPRW